MSTFSLLLDPPPACFARVFFRNSLSEYIRKRTTSMKHDAVSFREVGRGTARQGKARQVLGPS